MFPGLTENTQHTHKNSFKGSKFQVIPDELKYQSVFMLDSFIPVCCFPLLGVTPGGIPM